MMMSKLSFYWLLVMGLISTSCDDVENPTVSQEIEYVFDDFVGENYSEHYASHFTGYKLTTQSYDFIIVDYHISLDYIDSIRCVRYLYMKEKQHRLYNIRKDLENLGENCD